MPRPRKIEKPSKTGTLCKDCTSERPGKTHGICYVVSCSCIYHRAYTTRKPNWKLVKTTSESGWNGQD